MEGGKGEGVAVQGKEVGVGGWGDVVVGWSGLVEEGCGCGMEGLKRWGEKKKGVEWARGG